MGRWILNVYVVSQPSSEPRNWINKTTLPRHPENLDFTQERIID